MRSNYDVTVWSNDPPDVDGGSQELDASVDLTDGGDISRLPGSGGGLLFVTISLRPDACDLGASPPLDLGATYAIDIQGWRIMGWSP